MKMVSIHNNNFSFNEQEWFFYKALEHQINLYIFIVFVQFMFFRAALYRLLSQCRYALFHTVNEAGMNKSSSKLIYLNTDLI